MTQPMDGHPWAAVVEVLGEGRSIKAKAGRFADHFKPYAVHLYRIR